MAECALDVHFSEPDNLDRYHALRRRAERGRKQPAAVKPLQIWQIDGGSLVLRALADPLRFALELEHPTFGAQILATYDPDTVEMSQASVAELHGDKKAARKAARDWVDEQADGELGDDLAALLSLMTDDDDTPDLPDHEAEPGPPSDQDVKTIEVMARDLAKEMGRAGIPDLTASNKRWFEANPQTLGPIFDGFVTACKAVKRNDDLIAAYWWLLVTQLELIRYRHERGWEWATRLLDAYQQRLLQIGKDQVIAQDDWFRLAAALSHAKVPVSQATSEAFAELGGSEALPDGQELTMMRALIDQMAGAVERPYDVIDAFSELGAVLPTQVRSFMAQELALSPHAVLRDAAPLLLLDPDSGVRRTAAAALEQTAAADTMSPESLRRIIAVRNWIPEADRAAVDRAIRKARTKGVECAQWPVVGDLLVIASAVDGAGAQTVVASSPGNRKGLLAGILLKQGFGVRDTWCDHDKPRREINNVIRTLTREVGGTEVERSYIDIVIQHAIAVGLAAGNVPGPALLDIAESIGGVDWKDRQLDIAAEARWLLEALPAEERTDAAITRSLQRSGGWMERDKIAQSWFEDDAAVRELVARAPKGDKLAATELMLTEGLEQTREVWAERFLLLGLWARASKGRTQHARWGDFAVLAHELAGARPIAEIPIMVTIGERSAAVAQAGLW